MFKTGIFAVTSVAVVAGMVTFFQALTFPGQISTPGNCMRPIV